MNYLRRPQRPRLPSWHQLPSPSLWRRSHHWLRLIVSIGLHWRRQTAAKRANNTNLFSHVHNLANRSILFVDEMHLIYRWINERKKNLLISDVLSSGLSCELIRIKSCSIPVKSVLMDSEMSRSFQPVKMLLICREFVRFSPWAFILIHLFHPMNWSHWVWITKYSSLYFFYYWLSGIFSVWSWTFNEVSEFQSVIGYLSFTGKSHVLYPVTLSSIVNAYPFTARLRWGQQKH